MPITSIAALFALTTHNFLPQTGNALPGVRANYDKFEYMVPMRDGVKLYTAVYVPKTQTENGPILLERTPYSAGPYGSDNYKGGFRGSSELRKRGYIFAYQDVRGRYMSEGEFENVRPMLKKGAKGIDESTDTFDTVDFLVKNVRKNNGSVGLWGISYPGFYAGAGGVNSHPNLKAVSPQAPVSDWFKGDDFHHNGALFLQDGFGFLRGFGQPRPKPSPTGGESAPPIDQSGGAYDFYLRTGALKNFDPLYLKGRVSFWKDMMEHDTYDDFWKDRALPDHMTGVKCAVLTVGGWFDAEDLWGALNLYKNTERKNRGTYNSLVMGPWYHGMWASPTGQVFGDLDFGNPTSTYFQEQVELPFFEKFLRGQTVTAPPEVTAFNTGSNQWRQFDEWPPRGIRPVSYYFDQQRGLSTEKPRQDGADTYVADPANPTPYLAEPSNPRRTREYMIDDQRFLATRSDVVSYTTPAFTADQTFAGPIIADLWVTTTGTDGDFIVKVVDEWPADAPEKSPKGASMANYQQLVRFEVMRGKFRDNLSKPEPFKPGQPTRVKFTLNDWLHTVRAGHRLKIIVQSSMFPLIDRNPNQFLKISEANDADYIKATVNLLRSPRYPSRVELHTLPK